MTRSRDFMHRSMLPSVAQTYLRCKLRIQMIVQALGTLLGRQEWHICHHTSAPRRATVMTHIEISRKSSPGPPWTGRKLRFLRKSAGEHTLHDFKVHEST